jgi:Protein of unknown function (DUF2716)
MPYAWEELLYPSDEDTTAWEFMHQQLHFRPSVHAEHWPGIVEPHPSITYDIGHIYGLSETQAAALETDLNRKTLAAFQVCTRPDQRLYALDWQHACYWFYPHRPFDAENLAAWRVPVLPNGDYYIFLAEDFSFGMFGHPWEQTLCLFGQPLLDAFVPSQPFLFTQIVRVNGQAVPE